MAQRTDLTHLAGKLDLRAPYIVLEEAISSLSLDGCEIVFGFLELRFNELKLVRALLFTQSHRLADR